MEGWDVAPPDRYDELWAPFIARYGFVPGAVPAIDEPTPSVTFDLSGFFTAAEQSAFTATERAVNALALLAMTRVFGPDERVVALDWEHDCHWFHPHVQAVSAEPLWRLVVPNGDYYAFVSEDASTGTFGHPWEQTLCVFGRPMLDALAPLLAPLLPIIRDHR
ncbi:DUF2716 domain-containing protein [Dactylosporangium sp. NBC_01737]|uniref:DUF2716 domain-containing protein n=1 Tax=Dactylosporangium sp. NBC_01737 TaxID=2975959 RepID=UPI002E0ED0B9|nr:DUF2716 domain-containing protein [Dactylosporangium sp. NBC_01737]